MNDILRTSSSLSGEGIILLQHAWPNAPGINFIPPIPPLERKESPMENRSPLPSLLTSNLSGDSEELRRG